MSENTSKNPHEPEPQGTDSLDPQTPEETPESAKSIGAEAIVNAPTTDYPIQQDTRAYPQTRTMNANSPQGFSPQASSQQSSPPQTSPHQLSPQQVSVEDSTQPPSLQGPHSSGPGNLHQPDYQQAGYPQSGYHQSSYQQAGYQQSGYQPRTYSNQYPAPIPAPASAPAPGPAPGPAGQTPMRPMQPPRRKKPRPENVTYAPVTGTMPLTGDEVTEIPADGPIEWPHRRVGIVGVANLVLSAVMAVVWAWIPLGLLFTGVGGIFALGLGVLALVVWVLVQQGANVFERYRAELVYGDRIPVPKIERSTRESGFTRFCHNRWLHVKSGSFWRSTAHHYVKMLLGALIVVGTVAGICGGVIGVFSAINPEGVTTYFLGSSAGGLGRIGIAVGSLIVFASSVAILWFAPYLDRALDRSLLPPARTAALQAEVTELDRARMAGIEAAGAERLRIERDLHDGAQPRLVALSMTLGMAKSKIDTDPERAKELVSEAHSEAKGIVNELRQLARGIHPAVLTDRGLDAAVSALAGRSTIPVEVDVRLTGRIDREAEAVAYFVVAECLTNIAKHSKATHARVFIGPIETGVQVVITDNGVGGARIDRSGRHTGIAGLLDRVGAARGTLNLTSPAGGPTTVVVEVPCAS